MQASRELSIFLTLALGVALGKVKIKDFSLGSVTGVLPMGVLVGQLDLVISPTVKSAFFLIFLFTVELVDIVFRLAEKSSVVLLNGGGFVGPEWSVRVSLANLENKDYEVIGKQLSETMLEYVEAWKESK